VKETAMGIEVDDARKLEGQKGGKRLTLKMGATKFEVRAPSMFVVIRIANRSRLEIVQVSHLVLLLCWC